MKPSLCIVIPVYNEEKIIEENISSIISELGQPDYFTWSILLVENGSTDATLQLVKKLSDRYSFVDYVSSNVANYGLALQTGFMRCTSDFIVSFDIDYWDIRFVEVVAHVMQVRYDLIIASKNLLLSNDKRGPLRKLASYVFRMILFFVFGLRVSDTHGIKAWRNSDRMRGFFRDSTPGYHSYDTEVVIRAMHANCEVLEVPVEVVETRITDTHILKRVPRTLWELIDMRKRLRSQGVL
jgi:glycosyltransferase involved in cell wall biosynthesis